MEYHKIKIDNIYRKYYYKLYMVKNNYQYNLVQHTNKIHNLNIHQVYIL